MQTTKRQLLRCLTIAFFSSLLFLACGCDSSNGFNTPTGQIGIVPAGNPGNPGNPGPVFGQVVVNFDLAPVTLRTIPVSVATFDFEGFLGSTRVFASLNVTKAPQITLNNVPVDMDRFVITLRDAAGGLAGSFTLNNPQFVNGLLTINDPPFQDPPPTGGGGSNSNDLLSGNYAVHGLNAWQLGGGDAAGVLTLDGNGAITGGTIRVTDSFSSGRDFVYNVGAGSTYTLDQNRDFTATINTSVIPTLRLFGRATDDGALSVFATAEGFDDLSNGGAQEVASLVLHIQKLPTQEQSNQNLSSVYQFTMGIVGFQNGSGDEVSGGANGRITFIPDGGGGPSGTIQGVNSTITHTDSGINTNGVINISGGTYTVENSTSGRNGRITGTIDFFSPLGSLPFEGQIGADGSVAMAIGNSTIQAYGIATLAPTNAQQSDISANSFLVGAATQGNDRRGFNQGTLREGLFLGPVGVNGTTVQPGDLDFIIQGGAIGDLIVAVNNGVFDIVEQGNAGQGMLENSNVNVTYTQQLLNGGNPINVTLDAEGFLARTKTFGHATLVERGSTGPHPGTLFTFFLD